MAFQIKYMGKVSSSANTLALNVWTYNGLPAGGNETAAAIIASGYFNPFMQSVTQGYGPLQVGDIIFVSGSDTNNLVQVETTAPNVTVSPFLVLV